MHYFMFTLKWVLVFDDFVFYGSEEEYPNTLFESINFWNIHVLLLLEKKSSSFERKLYYMHMYM